MNFELEFSDKPFCPPFGGGWLKPGSCPTATEALLQVCLYFFIGTIIIKYVQIFIISNFLNISFYVLVLFLPLYNDQYKFYFTIQKIWFEQSWQIILRQSQTSTKVPHLVGKRIIKNFDIWQGHPRNWHIFWIKNTKFRCNKIFYNTKIRTCLNLCVKNILFYLFWIFFFTPHYIIFVCKIKTTNKYLSQV